MDADIIPVINLTVNNFYFGTDKNIEPNPCQYEFYNKYAEKVILPYEQNIKTLDKFLDQIMLTLKKSIFEEIIFYKFNNFNFNFNYSFFIKLCQELLQLLQNPSRNQQIKVLQIISVFNNKQFYTFEPKLNNLLELLKSITTPSIEHDLLVLLQNQIFTNLKTNLIDQIIIEINNNNIPNPPLTNYDTKLDNLTTIFNTFIPKINIINDEIYRILRLGPVQQIDNSKQNKLIEYISTFISLNAIFDIIKNSFPPTITLIPIDNNKVSILETNLKQKFKKLYNYNKFLNKIYREKDLQIITNNLDKPSKQIERDELLNIAKFNKEQLFGHYEPAQYKRVFLPYYISLENIIEIIKLRINGQLSEEQLNIIIYNYNIFNYNIVIGDETNNLFYMNSSINNGLYNQITNTISGVFQDITSPITSKNKNYFKIQINNNGNANANITYSSRITPPAVTQPITPSIYIYIPITQEINKIYDNEIKQYLFEYNSIPKGIYLKSYTKKFELINISINLRDKTYNFQYNDYVNPVITIKMPLYDLIKNEKIKLPLKFFNYNYNYKSLPPIQDININILDFYEDIDEEKIQNIFGNIQSKYNSYILFEQLKTKINLKQEIYIEDYILCLFESFNENIGVHYISNQYIPIIKTRIIEPLTRLFNQLNNPLLTEKNYFYMNEKSKEIIYKETNRGIVMIRLICIILYIARIYYNSTDKHYYFENYMNIKTNFEAYLQNPNLINNLFSSIFNFFDTNIKRDTINAEFINSIIIGSLFSKEKDLFIKKQNILEQSIETATENIENIASEMDKFVHKDDFSIKTIEELTGNAINYMFNKKKEDYKSESVNITDFEEKNFSLTTVVIENRVKQWITGPIYNIPDWMPNIDNVNDINIVNEKIVCPDVIQFIGEYLNNKSGTDLISIKNKEQICKNISSLKNTIEKNTSQIKYILPKTFFDDEYFMTKYLKSLNESTTKKK